MAHLDYSIYTCSIVDGYIFFTAYKNNFPNGNCKAIQKREQPATTLQITRSHKAKFNPPFVPFTRAIKQN